MIRLITSGISAFALAVIMILGTCVLVLVSPALLFIGLWHYRYNMPKITYKR